MRDNIGENENGGRENTEAQVEATPENCRVQ